MTESLIIKNLPPAYHPDPDVLLKLKTQAVILDLRVRGIWPYDDREADSD